MKIPIPKLKALLLYFGTYTDKELLGKVKLMKLIYFADFLHVKKYGSPITYDTYIKLEHGPVPSAIKNLVDTAYDDVDNSMLADTIRFDTSGGYIHRVIPQRIFSEKDKNYFSDTELEILRNVVERFGDKNARFIEEASHEESPWKETNFLEEIPYSLATHDDDCNVSREEIEMLMNI
ncbi:MAG: Panacea domain-containing protein [Patescibacteria group bacterium]|jgi:uncharacterized phage-associated protein